MKHTKRIVLVVAIAAAMLPLGSVGAQGHGTCTLSAPKPSQASGTIFWYGVYGCNGQVHSAVSVNATLQRRTHGTSSWTNVATVSNSQPNVVSVASGTGQAAYNCVKDYRNLAGGAASPGGHGASKASNVLLPTC